MIFYEAPHKLPATLKDMAEYFGNRNIALVKELTKIYENVAAGSYKFKVARDHSWNTAYPGSDKSYTVATDGSTVIITLKGTTVTVDVKASHTHS
jgi:16S rRNA (cytidine1402-2'-O)-methyltransferase